MRLFPDIFFFIFVVELWPMIYVWNLFLLYFFKTNGKSCIKVCICIDFEKIQIGIDTCIFLQILNRDMALD